MAEEISDKKEEDVTKKIDLNNLNNDDNDEKIEINIECKNLPNSSSKTKISSTFVVLTLLDPHINRYLEYGRTETIKNELSPSFSESIYVNYHFELKQTLKFDIYSQTGAHNADDLKNNEFVGTCSIILGAVLKAPGQEITQKLMKLGDPVKDKNNKYSLITIKCDKFDNTEYKNKSSTVMIKFEGINLPKMDQGLTSLSDPYLEIWRYDKNNKTYKKIYSTEIIKRTLNPKWSNITMNTYKLCRNDYNNKILLKIYDWDKNSDDDFIGSIETTLNKLKNRPTLMIQKLTKKTKKDPKIKVSIFKEINASVMDYLCGGTEIEVIFGVDYTYSNGTPTDKTSLHHVGDGWKPTPYGNAIKSIGKILEVYDTDKKFPLYGFGGRLFDDNKTKDIFAVNGNEDEPYEIGIENLHQCYVDTLKQNKVKLGGKLDQTNFAPLIKKTYDMALNSKNNSENKYYVLVIITDGLINDMKSTKKLIIDAANKPLPLSIIIIGVGKANFKKMDELDGDNERVSLLTIKNGVIKAERDIVQFVAFREKKNHLDLTNETLKEIPTQMMSYYLETNIKPKPKVKKIKDFKGKKVKDFDNEYLLNKDDELKKIENFDVEKDPKKQQIYEEIDLPIGWSKLHTPDGFIYFADSQGKPYKNPPIFDDDND